MREQRQRTINLRIATTRQINQTTHERHSHSMDLSFAPGKSGITAGLGNRWDSLQDEYQWTGTVGWRRKTTQLSLHATQSDLRLQGRLRW